MDKVIIFGREYRVEVNWRAITNYLKSRDEDSLDAMADVFKMKPSTIPGLMAACINEGERLEGRDTVVTESLLNEMAPLEALKVVKEFADIFNSQMVPVIPEEPKKGEAW